MPESYLVVRLGSFGDVLLTTGVLTFWNKSEGCRFHVVTKAGFSDIFKHHPAVDRTIPVNNEDLTVKGWWDLCRGLAKSYSSTGLIDLHGNLRTSFLRHAWSGKVRSYPKMSFCRRLYAGTKLSIFKNRLLEKNVPERYAAALSANIPKQSDLLPRLYLKPAEILDAKKRLARLGLEGRIICLHPYATHKAKAWPPEKWKRLTGLLKTKDLDWIVIGQNSTPIFPSNPRDLTNQTSIRETGAIISRCSALITGDSGPMHLASSVNTRIIGLFGPTTREWGFYPTGPDDIIIESDLGCRPCSLHGKDMGKCRAECMINLEPESVIKALKNIRP